MRHRVCAWAATAGVVVFAVAAIVQPFYRHDRTFNDPYSSYATGSLGWVQTVAFVALGSGSLALSVGLSKPPTVPPGWRPGRVLLGSWAIGVLLAAIFPLDGGPVWISGYIHSAVSAVAFLSITAASLTLSHAFTSTQRLPATSRVSRWTARSVLVLFLLAITTQHLGWFGLT